MSGGLDRKTILGALEALSERMGKKRIRAHIYIVGGAAMALTCRRSRTTFDMDALIVEETGSVMQAAREIAKKRGLPRNWLNDDVKSISLMLPRRDRRATTVLDSPHLVVTGASAAHLLAMKAHAGRDQDLEDIKLLASELGVRTMRQVLEIHDAVFPRKPIPLPAAERVKSLLRDERLRSRSPLEGGPET